MNFNYNNDYHIKWPLTKRQKHLKSIIIRWFYISSDGIYKIT